ncbi:MAG: glycosyltransferase family 2 protein [Microbacterium sp.]
MTATGRSVRTALIVVNFASSGLIAQNLGGMTLPDGVSVVVVDCYSSADERARVAALCDAQGWRAVLLDENAGFGGGVNAGASRAIADGAEVIATLNPDATIDEGSLTALIAAAVADPSALVSPRIVTGDGRSWFAGSDLYLDDGSTAGRRRRTANEGRPRIEWATGACFAMSASLWERTGGFDDEYFLYWEDVDLSRRVQETGGRLALLESAVAVHDEGQTHGRSASDRAKSETYYYFNIRNRLIYAAKHLDDAGVSRWLRTARAVSYGILLQGGRRQLLVSRAPWRAYRRGLRDGRAFIREERGITR